MPDAGGWRDKLKTSSTDFQAYSVATEKNTDIENTARGFISNVVLLKKFPYFECCQLLLVEILSVEENIYEQMKSRLTGFCT